MPTTSRGYLKKARSEGWEVESRARSGRELVDVTKVDQGKTSGVGSALGRIQSLRLVSVAF